MVSELSVGNAKNRKGGFDERVYCRMLGESVSVTTIRGQAGIGRQHF